MPLPAAIPWIGAAIAAIGRMLIARAGPVVASALLWFGLSITFADVAVQPILDQVAAYLGGAPGTFLDTVGYVGGDIALSMIISAHAVAFASKLRFRKNP